MMVNFVLVSSFQFLSIFMLWGSIYISTSNSFPLLPSFTTSNRHDLLMGTKHFQSLRHYDIILFSQNNDKYDAISQMVNSDNDEEPSEIIEARILRARAEELRIEARAMELALLERAAKQRKDKDEITDEIIAQIFSPLKYQNIRQLCTERQNTTMAIKKVKSDNGGGEEKSASMTTTILPDARVVADRLKHGELSRQQILSVVDRLNERYQEGVNSADQDSENVIINEAKSHAKEEDEQKQELNEKIVDNDRCNDYLAVLLQASAILDQQFEANALQKTTKSSSPITINPKFSSFMSSLTSRTQRFVLLLLWVS